MDNKKEKSKDLIELANYKENLVINDDDKYFLKVAKYFIKYEDESKVAEELRDIIKFYDKKEVPRRTTKEDIKLLIDRIIDDGFIEYYQTKRRLQVENEYMHLSLEDLIKEPSDLEIVERNENKEKEMQEIEKELEEFKTIIKMINIILENRLNNDI